MRKPQKERVDALSVQQRSAYPPALHTFLVRRARPVRAFAPIASSYSLSRTSKSSFGDSRGRMTDNFPTVRLRDYHRVPIST
jgi:hypothetical protein